MKKILYYVAHNDVPNQGRNACVVAVYTDGSARTWYKGEPGYKSAKAKASSPKRKQERTP